MKIGIDMMGGDNPKEIVGAVKKFLLDEKVEIVIFAKQGDLNAEKLDGLKGVEIVYTFEEIQKDDDPAFVIRKRKDSSLVVGVQYLKDKKLDAFISAGNTGAIVAAGIFVLKRKNGVSKPALPGFFPRMNSDIPVMLLDLGANIYATKENLLDYCDLSIDYMKKYYGLEDPVVKLLNIGEEENKGIDLQREVYKELKNKDINFQGNIEPRDIMDAECDIILMDGWSGNIMLKSIEGSVSFLGENLKGIFYKNFLNKIAALILKKDLMTFYEKFDYRAFGATPVLGVDGLLLKAHGSSDEKAFISALKQAKKIYEINN